MVDDPKVDSPTDDDKGASDSPDLDKFNDDDIKGLDEESQKKVKGFHADYTKKTQRLAEKEKEFEQRMAALEEKARSGEKWDKWFLDNDDLVQEFNDWKARKDQGPADDDVGDDDDLDDPSVKKLKKSVAQTQEDMNKLTKATQTSNKMLLDLMSEMQRKEIRELPFDIDPKRVLEFAKENNIYDMKRALLTCYADDIKEDEFQKRLADEKEKWNEQNKTKVVTTMPQGRQVRRVIARKRGSTE